VYDRQTTEHASHLHDTLLSTLRFDVRTASGEPLATKTGLKIGVDPDHLGPEESSMRYFSSMLGGDRACTGAKRHFCTNVPFGVFGLSCTLSQAQTSSTPNPRREDGADSVVLLVVQRA